MDNIVDEYKKTYLMLIKIETILKNKKKEGLDEEEIKSVDRTLKKYKELKEKLESENHDVNQKELIEISQIILKSEKIYNNIDELY